MLLLFSGFAKQRCIASQKTTINSYSIYRVADKARDLSYTATNLTNNYRFPRLSWKEKKKKKTAAADPPILLFLSIKVPSYRPHLYAKVPLVGLEEHKWVVEDVVVVV